MAAVLTVIFTPGSRADYEDVLVVVAQSGKLEVPLRGARPRPALTLAREIDLGDVLVGNTRYMQVIAGGIIMSQVGLEDTRTARASAMVKEMAFLKARG
jgi:hypothetical protein